jgi:general secretion pathway protein K
MIIIVVLMAFLTLSYFVLNAYQDSISTYRFIFSVYNKEQALYITKSAFEFAKIILDRDDPSVDTLKDSWALPYEFEKDGVSVKLTIYDENRFINLNNTKDTKYRKIYENLFKDLNISDNFLKRLYIWTGAEEGSILIDYPVKRKPLDSLEELKLIGFLNDDLYGKMIGETFYPGLLSVSTVYTDGKININTAPPVVLKALNEKIDDTLISKIIEYRNKKPFKSINDLVLIDGFTFDMLYQISNYIDVKSNVFHIKIETTIGDTTLQTDYIYNRSAKKVIYKTLI